MGGTTSGAQAASQMETAGAGGWDAAATPPAPQSAPVTPQPPSASQPSQSPAAPPMTTPTGAAPGSTPSPVVPAQAQPVVVTSQKAPGIMGVVDSIADALVGKTKPEIGTDAQGNQYVKQQTMSRGQQWIRIGAGLVGGAAKGFAAGKGRNPGAAAAAGFDQGQQQAKDAAAQTPELQKQILANANYQKLRMDAAEQSWHLTAMQHEASEHDVQFAQGQEDRLMKVDGATLLGTAASPNDIEKILHADPDVMKSMIQNHQIEILPHYNADGTAAGIRVFKMPDGYRKTIEPAGTTFHTFDSTTGQYVEHKSSEPLTAGEVDDYETSAGNAAQKFKLDQANIAQKAAETEQAKANASKVPSEIAESKARTTEAYANAQKSIAEANKQKTLAADDPSIANLGELAAKGGLTEDQISKFGKGTLGAVQNYLAEHHSNLDQTSIFLTANDRKQRTLAGNSLENINHIDEILKRRPDLIGVLNGRITQGKIGAGTNDKDLGYIEEAIDNFGLATTGTHGTRAQAAREDARKALINGFKNGPQAVQGAIEAARNSLGNLASVGKPRGLNGSPYAYNQQPQGSSSQQPQAKTPIAPPAGAPAGASQVWHDAQGKVVGYTVNGSYQAAQ